MLLCITLLQFFRTDSTNHENFLPTVHRHGCHSRLDEGRLCHHSKRWLRELGSYQWTLSSPQICQNLDIFPSEIPDLALSQSFRGRRLSSLNREENQLASEKRRPSWTWRKIWQALKSDLLILNFSKSCQNMF